MDRKRESRGQGERDEKEKLMDVQRLRDWQRKRQI